VGRDRKVITAAASTAAVNTAAGSMAVANRVAVNTAGGQFGGGGSVSAITARALAADSKAVCIPVKAVNGEAEETRHGAKLRIAQIFGRLLRRTRLRR
jgi:hypothetical protein